MDGRRCTWRHSSVSSMPPLVSSKPGRGSPRFRRILSRNTPLHAAVAGRHADVSVFLIERGADVNAIDSGRHTPLHIAAEDGQLPVVKALLTRGADPHAVDAEDKTPMSRAAARNHAAVVDALNLKG
jgi:ankyrin repeat protein